MTDTLEFQMIDPFAEGEPWATDFGAGVHRAVAVVVNGIDLCDHLREFEGKKAHAYGHNLPEELYGELSAATAWGSCSWYEGAEVLCCFGCGLTDCYRVDSFVTAEEKAVHWCIRSRNVQDAFLFFTFEKTAYLHAMQELYRLADEPTHNPLEECSKGFTVFHAVMRFYAPRTHDEYQGLCVLAETLGTDRELSFSYAHGQTGLYEYLRQAGFSEAEIKSSGVCELPGEALLRPLYDGCMITGIAVLQASLTTFFDGVWPEEEYTEWSV